MPIYIALKGLTLLKKQLENKLIKVTQSIKIKVYRIKLFNKDNVHDKRVARISESRVFLT